MRRPEGKSTFATRFSCAILRQANTKSKFPNPSAAISIVVGSSMHEIETEVQVRASIERVWSILSDLASYPSWNPFITHIEGKLEKGHRLRATIKPVGGRPMTFKPTVLSVVPNQELRWLGHLYIPGLFDGEHSFALAVRDNGTRLVQSERFTGLLVPLLRKSLEQGTRPGFEAMNAALARRAEQSM